MCSLSLLASSLMACSGTATTLATDDIGPDAIDHAATADSHDRDDVHSVVPTDSDVAWPEPDVTGDDALASPAADVGTTHADAPGPDLTVDVDETPPEELPWLDDPTWQCENGVPISAVVDVHIPENPAGCPWNEGDNLNEIQGAFAAHQVTIAAAELPGPAAAICHVNLASADFDPDYAQPFIYDDHFILAFNDVVLLSSYGSLVDSLPTERNLILFDWNAIAGAAMNFNNNSAYCLGYGGDDPVECSIPAPESNGPVSYSVGGGLGAALSGRAVQEQRAEFMLVTFGDNDPGSDCRNSELHMQLVIDYVIAP